MRVKDAIFKTKLTKGDIKNLRTQYNSIIDSVFYLTEDIADLETLMNDKLVHRARLQLQARLLDQYINELFIYDHNKNNQSGDERESTKKITLQYLAELSSLSQKVHSKQKAPTKVQKEKRK